MQIKMQYGGGGWCEEVNGISQLSMENVHT